MDEYLKYYSGVEYIRHEEKNNEINIIFWQNKPNNNCLIKSRKTIKYKDLPINGKPVNLIIDRPGLIYENQEKPGKKFTPDISFVNETYRVTNRLYDYIIERCSNMSFQDVGKEIGLTEEDVISIYYSYYYLHVMKNVQIHGYLAASPLTRGQKTAWYVVNIPEKKVLDILSDKEQFSYWIVDHQKEFQRVLIPVDKDLISFLRINIPSEKIQVDSTELMDFIKESCWNTYIDNASNNLSIDETGKSKHRFMNLDIDSESPETDETDENFRAYYTLEKQLLEQLQAYIQSNEYDLDYDMKIMNPSLYDFLDFLRWLYNSDVDICSAENDLKELYSYISSLPDFLSDIQVKVNVFQRYSR